MRSDELDGFGLFGVQPVVEVADMAVALAFYRDVLGFQVDFVAGEPPVHARVSSGDRVSGTAVRIRLVPTSDGARPQRAAYCWAHVDNRIDELFERYRDAGVDIVSPPQDQPWGLREFRFRDPDGHLYCLVAEPS